jgi:hypothetical protein
LQSEGVYFTVDEFKGKTKVEGEGLKFEVNEKAFDNRYVGGRIVQRPDSDTTLASVLGPH